MNANLYQRCKLDGRYQFLRSAKPGFVLKDGAEIPAPPNAPFYVRVSNDWTRVVDPTKIKAASEHATVKAQAERLGIIEKRQVAQTKGDLIADAVDDFLKAKQKKNRAPRTLLAYERALSSLRDSVDAKHVLELNKKVIIKWYDSLESLSARTRLNMLEIVRTWMLWQKLPWTIDMSEETEKPMKKVVTIYSQAQLDALQRVADYDERDLILFALGSGCREQEIQYTTYADVNDGTLHIRLHKEYPEHRIKDHEERLIPLADEVLRVLGERRKRHPEWPLIFSQKGKPDGHLLRIIKRVGKRAGLAEEDATLHRFRRTFASRLMNEGMSHIRIMELLVSAES
jgi:integrase